MLEVKGLTKEERKALTDEYDAKEAELKPINLSERELSILERRREEILRLLNGFNPFSESIEENRETCQKLWSMAVDMQKMFDVLQDFEILTKNFTYQTDKRAYISINKRFEIPFYTGEGFLLDFNIFNLEQTLSLENNLRLRNQRRVGNRDRKSLERTIRSCLEKQKNSIKYATLTFSQIMANDSVSMIDNDRGDITGMPLKMVNSIS